MKVQHVLDHYSTADLSSKLLEARAGYGHCVTACTDVYTGCMYNADSLCGKVYVTCLQQPTHAPPKFNRDSLAILTACLFWRMKDGGHASISTCFCIHYLMPC